MPVISNVLVPIPICDEGDGAILPGDGTISGYLEELAKNAGEEGIMSLLQHFELQVFSK